LDENQLRQAIELLYFGYRAFTDAPDRILEERGLNRVHHRILYFVGRTPGLSVARLLGVLKVTKQALNAPLRQLMEMRLVAMGAAAHDKRVRELTLTPAGRKLEAQLSGTQLKQLRGVFDEAGEEAFSGWLRVMKALADHR
jgi:DNA-binding MarR family transcriptional regulator